MLKRFLFEEIGQAMVLFAISLVALIGFAGLAIDGGRLYLAKSQLQKAVDAGALAGGQELLQAIKNSGPSSVDYTSISTTVNNMAEGNYQDGAYTYDPDKHGTKAVEVHGEETVNLLLMPVLKINNSSVKAVARVKIGNVSKVDKGIVIPVGINFDMLKDPSDPTGTKLQYGVELTISSSPGTGTNGYYGFLDFTSLPGVPKTCGGACALEQYISNGSPVPISIGQEISPENGVQIGKVEPAITAREGDIVYVPIVTGPNADGKYVVEGFAAFELIEYITEKEAKDQGLAESHIIKAKFLHTVIDGEVGGGTIDYGVYDAKLEL